MAPTESAPRQRRILCVDNYDSFVWTIVGYLRHLGAHVDVVRNDQVDLSLIDEGARGAAADGERTYDGVLVSPGPGRPEEAGSLLDVIDVCARWHVPMLGVCLGHQGLGEYFGADVVRAPKLMHGKTSPITHDGRGVFAGAENPLTVTRYHSLVVDPATVPECLEVSATTDSGIIMALRHRELPLEGVQFHPESVMTRSGHLMLANWLAACGDADAPRRARELTPVVAERSELTD